MVIDGGCYCGNIRYRINGEFSFEGVCYCRECQYITGGGPNYFAVVSKSLFSWVRGEPKSFKREDVELSEFRDFCPDCGTHIVSRPFSLPDSIVLKIGTMDDPKYYNGPTVGIFLCDKLNFHLVHHGIDNFQKNHSL